VGTPVPGIEVQIEHRGLFALKGGAPGRSPDIASDGRSVLFERPAGGAQRDGIVLLGGFDSEEPRALGRGSAPRFSRDGKWITFLRRRDGQTDVWLMRADGSGKRQLTNSSFDEEYPSVSPDGAHVVFASVRPPSSQSQIYLLRVQDGKQMQLTQAGQNSRPLW
jgi:TolB protein